MATEEAKPVVAATEEPPALPTEKAEVKAEVEEVKAEEKAPEAEVEAATAEKKDEEPATEKAEEVEGDKAADAPAKEEAPVATEEVKKGEKKEKKFLRKYSCFVGNLSYSVTDASLTAFFTESKLKVVSLRMPRDFKFKKPKGFAFVEFDSEEAQQGAVKLNGKQLDGRPINVEVTSAVKEPKDARRAEWTDESIVEMRFAMSCYYVRAVIGKKGEAIKQASQESGAKLMFGERLPESWNLGPELQHLTIKGKLEQCEKAILLISQIIIKTDEEKGNGQTLDKFSRAKYGQVSLTLVVPLDRIAMIIGSKGSRIKELEKETATSFDVQDDQLYDEKYLTITGTPEKVCTAVQQAARGVPVDAWDPMRPTVTPKTRSRANERRNGGREGQDGGYGGRGGPRGGGRGYNDYGPSRGSPRGGGGGRPPYDDYYDYPPQRGYGGYDPEPAPKRFRGPPPSGPARGYDDYSAPPQRGGPRDRYEPSYDSYGGPPPPRRGGPPQPRGYW